MLQEIKVTEGFRVAGFGMHYRGLNNYLYYLGGS